MGPLIHLTVLMRINETTRSRMPNSCYGIWKGSGNGTCDLFLFLPCSSIMKRDGSSTRYSGSWFSTQRKFTSPQTTLLELQPFCWFICFYSSPTVTTASAVNQRSFKGTANLNHRVKESGGWGNNIHLQYVVSTESQITLAQVLHLEVSSRCFLLNNKKVRIPWKRTVFLKKPFWST